MPYVDKANCSRKYAQENIKLSPSQICAGGLKAKDSCSGDSGSPLMRYDNKKFQWILTGIVSFGQKKCGTEGFPAVYVLIIKSQSIISHHNLFSLTATPMSQITCHGSNKPLVTVMKKSKMSFHQNRSIFTSSVF